MKKITLIFLTFLTLYGCSDDVQFNTPGFQGNKNYNLWRATFFNAVVSSDGIIITAGNNSEDMTIRLSSAAVSTNPYLLTDTSFSRAEFTDFENIDYSTSNPPDPSVSLYPEIGEVLITESTPEYISGKFRFIAFTQDGLNSVGFNEGDFYRIPINGGGNIGNTINCEQATTNLITATTNFSEVMPSDDNYSARCDAYKTALQDALTACGDTTGAFQAIIDSLGDCSGGDTPEGVISVVVGTLTKTFETNITVTEDGGVRSIRAEDDTTNDWISFDVNAGETGVDVISNFTLHLITTDYFPATNGAGSFTSEITVNTTPSIRGAFNGPVESTDGADLSLTQGVIDIIY